MPKHPTAPAKRRPTRDVWIVGGLLTAIAAAIAILAIAVLARPPAPGDIVVARANGQDITRSDLEGRLALAAFLRDELDAVTQSRINTGFLAPDERGAIIDALSPANSTQASQETLVDDALVAAETDRRGLARGEADPYTLLADQLARTRSLRVRWVVFGREPNAGNRSGAGGATVATGDELAPFPADEAGAIAAASAALRSGDTAAAILTGLRGGGWAATGQDSWLDAGGEVLLPPAIGLPGPALTVSARASRAGDLLGPLHDVDGNVVLGLLVGSTPTGPSAAELRIAATTAGVPESAIAAWARATARRQALWSALEADARASGDSQSTLDDLAVTGLATWLAEARRAADIWLAGSPLATPAGSPSPSRLP